MVLRMGGRRGLVAGLGRATADLSSTSNIFNLAATLSGLGLRLTLGNP